MNAAMLRILHWFGFGGSSHDHHHHHEDEHDGRGHIHGVMDPSIATTSDGIRAVKISFLILALTAAMQLSVVFTSGSVALLADTIHNIGDATTALPLWLAFALARRPASRTFNYGLGRVEDLAGIAIVLIILASAIVAFYEAVSRFVHPQAVTDLGWLAAAGVIGFLGNEAVALFRISVGRRINSAALVADGYHARTDGLTSLAVVLGATGVWLGFPLADPVVGLLITIAILGIVWQSARAVLVRMLDGIDPGILEEIAHAASHVEGVTAIRETRARWSGHRLHVDVVVVVDPATSVAAANEVSERLRRELSEHLPALERATVQFADASVDKSQGPPMEAPAFRAVRHLGES